MGFVAKEKIRAGAWKITAEIDADTFGQKVEEIFAEQLPKLSIPGFRKGKVPRAMLEKRYGEKLFFEDALDALLPGEVNAAVSASELVLALRPQDLNVESMERETGVKYDFTAIVKPELTVAGWRGLEAPYAPQTVTEADVDARVEELRDRNARMVEVEGRAAQTGDSAEIDYEGFADGVPFEGGKAENYELQLGSGSFIPGFEEQVVGHLPGEEFDINITFPEQYHSEELAGKQVVFKIKLHAIKAKELPELDDDFAQEVGENYETVADLRSGIEAELLESRRRSSEDGFTAAVQQKLAALAEGEIADEVFAQRAERNKELFADRIGVPVERYLEYTGLDREKFDADMRERAEEQLKLELALEDIARQEALEAAPEEIEAEQERMAAEYNVDIARVKFAVPEEDIRAGLLREKALGLAKEAAVKVEPPAEEATEEEAETEEAAE
ncbi:MAG: trigger factor [Oscillospiraceae bacterium]|jgi:trigger factor|nr:trigger factor [Oscillospiraceae bacterium]